MKVWKNRARKTVQRCMLGSSYRLRNPLGLLHNWWDDHQRLWYYNSLLWFVGLRGMVTHRIRHQTTFNIITTQKMPLKACKGRCRTCICPSGGVTKIELEKRCILPSSRSSFKIVIICDYSSECICLFWPEKSFLLVPCQWCIKIGASITSAP